MGLLDELKRQRGLYACCPNCQDEFRISEAGLFDATKPLSGRALAHLEELRADLKEANTDFKLRQSEAARTSRVAAESVNIGFVVEKIAPSLPGFPLHPGDCRSLFQPIDYAAFKGLATTGKVDALVLLEVKSGNSRLEKRQQAIRKMLEDGQVKFTIADDSTKRKP